jgi:hypothetical protein
MTTELQFRPYSKSELSDMEKDVYARHRLGDVIAAHVPCLHEYRVRKGGRKEQLITSEPSDNKCVMTDQTCSICFKLRTTVGSELPPVLPAETDPMSKDKINRIDEFYRWLYRHDS